jgi:hypothetical protein
VRIRQRVYFRIWSDTITAAGITARLGIEPDDFKIVGSRSTHPPIPRFHQWAVNCNEPGLRIDDQIAKVVLRLEPYRSKLADLSLELTRENALGGAELQVVRYYDDEDGEEEFQREALLPDGSVLETLPGQHQLLGWHLDARTLAFLQAVGAEVDVDEYG